MAIAYKEEALPKVAAFPFDITHWKGVNKIKANRYDQEMADCRNMSVDNYPYASPRKPRKKVVDEDGIKRIYKVENDVIHYIDNSDCIACHNGKDKELLTYIDEFDGLEKQIVVNESVCTNNYDSNTVFYPDMMYVNYEGKPVYVKHPLSFGKLSSKDEYVQGSDEFEDGKGYVLEVSTIVYITDTNASSVNISMVFPKATSYKYPYLTTNLIYMPRIRMNICNSDGVVKDLGGKNYIDCYVEITGRKNNYTINIPDNVTLEDGDYILFRLGMYAENNDYTLQNWLGNMKYALTADWYIDNSIATLKLNYGVVYNNRIVGVTGNDIRASALGDFTNFWEFADEAGNPSATGAYATDVGSAGNFTGICVYNNMVMLFKKNLVYEMYGSMPYNISELCATGCIDNDSICEIDGVLYWASPKGIVRYSGGAPTVISYEIDIDTSGTCKSGTDGRKYYVYDGKKIFVYDTLYRVWHIEDEKEVSMFYGESNELYMVSNDGIYKLNCGEENVEWEFETKDFTFNSEERKNLSKLWIRAEMSRQSRLEVYVRQNGGEWTRSAVKTAEKDEMFDFKLRIKKCDSFALKFKGVGDVRILDVHGKVTVGTSKHRSGASLNVYR